MIKKQREIKVFVDYETSFHSKYTVFVLASSGINNNYYEVRDATKMPYNTGNPTTLFERGAKYWLNLSLMQINAIYVKTNYFVNGVSKENICPIKYRNDHHNVLAKIISEITSDKNLQDKKNTPEHLVKLKELLGVGGLKASFISTDNSIDKEIKSIYNKKQPLVN